MVRNGDFGALDRKKTVVSDDQEVSCFHCLHTCRTDSEIHFDSNSVCCYVIILIAGVVLI